MAEKSWWYLFVQEDQVGSFLDQVKKYFSGFWILDDKTIAGQIIGFLTSEKPRGIFWAEGLKTTLQNWTNFNSKSRSYSAAFVDKVLPNKPEDIVSQVSGLLSWETGQQTEWSRPSLEQLIRLTRNTF